MMVQGRIIQYQGNKAGAGTPRSDGANKPTAQDGTRCSRYRGNTTRHLFSSVHNRRIGKPGNVVAAWRSLRGGLLDTQVQMS